MNMTNITAMARARSMIEVICHSLVPGLAYRNKEMADGYIASIYDAGLIDRNQFEDLKAEVEMAFTTWTVKTGFDKHV
ncbi:hypothetical protein ACI2KS_23885 [Pseudomonas sp. NPDC087358]|uniref:hypothetical protein n=1 Tax=Pseudomonas sp. NPDC087358 TaxID=3364439 RepID=UPI00384F6068